MPSSILYPNELILDDDTPNDFFRIPSGFGAGLDLSQRTDEGYAGVADMFPSELMIPSSEWQARIQEMEETKSRVSDISINAGLPPKNQASTNYCWINAPTHCVEITRVIMNQPMVILSPASAGGPIKGFRNVGGWGKEGLEWIIKNGLVPVSKWPANAIDRQYYTEENKKEALKYRVTEWWELQPTNIGQLMSCLLRRIPVAVGLSWWSHEVTFCDPVWLDGQAVIRFRNSWGESYGENGFSILRGSKMIPDDAVCARVAIAA